MNRPRALLAAAMLFTFATFEFLSANNFVFISRTADGYTLGLPAYEKRTIPVTKDDIAILKAAQKLLRDDSRWDNASTRDCSPEPSHTLFCALRIATEKQTGAFNPHQPAMQHVRFAIEDRFPRRWETHRLADFNSDPDTEHSEVLAVLYMASRVAAEKLHRIRQANRRLGRTE